MRGFWYVACRSKEIGRKPVAVEILGEKLVVWREAEGKVAALRDLCSHRQVQLSKGRVEGGCIECPYHGWRFNGRGECVAIPSLCEGDKIPAKSRVASYPIREEQGYVWVFLGDQEPQEGPFLLPHYEEKGWASTRFTAWIKNDVEPIVENFIDCPHTGYIHGGLFRTAASHAATAEIRVGEKTVAIEVKEEEKAPSLFARLLVKNAADVRHIDTFHLPSIVEVSYTFGPKVAFTGVQICTPVRELLTRVDIYVVWRFGCLTGLLRGVVPWIARYVLHQDLWILENQGEQARRYGRTYSSVPADAGNNAILLMRRRAAKGAASPETGVIADAEALAGDAATSGAEKKVRFRL